MMKVLAVGQYDGTFNNKNGEKVNYSKVMLTVSENGNYPKLVAVDIPVYQNAGSKLLGREVELLYINSYGKMKVKEIKLV